MEDITKECKKCGKKFLVITQEQEFLTKKKLPFPDLCPVHRQEARLELRGSRTLFKVNCSKCQTGVFTSNNPETTKNPILCKKCYLEYFEKQNIFET